MIQINNIKLDKNNILIGLAILAVLITGFLIFANSNSNNNIFSFLKLGSRAQNKAIVQKAIDYLNKNVLQKGQAVTLGDVSEESGVVKFQVKIGANTYDSYITKDGKLFFPQAYNLLSANQANRDNQQTGQADISKVKISGEPFTGKDNAPVVIAYWSDYQCPFCKKLETEVMTQLIKDYVNTGKVKIVFKDYQFLGADSQTIGRFARAIWQVAPEKFYQWHKAMFDNQGRENSGWATEGKIMSITANAIGVNDANRALASFKSKGNQYQQIIDASKTEGLAFGINGTPAVVVGKQRIDGAQPYSTFKSAIDEELNKK